MLLDGQPASLTQLIQQLELQKSDALRDDLHLLAVGARFLGGFGGIIGI